MNALMTAGVVFVCTASTGLLGLTLGRQLPRHHLDADSRDAVRLVAGLVATLAALVLGLLIASAKANYDERSGQLHRMAADIVALDRALVRYGDSAREARAVLHVILMDEVERLSADGRLRGTGLNPALQDPRLPAFQDRLLALAPRSDAEHAAYNRAIQLSEGIAATRVLMTQDLGGSIPVPFLLVLGAWLAALFAAYGLFARANITVVAALLIGAASVSGAVFLILELDRPLDGIMRLSTEPLRRAAETVGE